MREGTGPDGRGYAAFLFDMDGTLLDSRRACARIWRRWAARHAIDADALLGKIHGMRAIDSMRLFAPPGTDVVAEEAELTRQEIADTEGVVEIPGAIDFLSRLPADRWALVTSASRELAWARLAAAGIAPPRVAIFGEDVARGKPDPACYLAAAGQLGVSAPDCLIFEDAPAGIAAGVASGGRVAAITHTGHALGDAGHFRLSDYRGLSARLDPAGQLQLVGLVR